MMTPYAKLIVPLFQIMVLLLFLSPMASLPSTLPLYFFISLNDAKQPLNAIKKTPNNATNMLRNPNAMLPTQLLTRTRK
jgi:hypothetical protein